VSAWRVGGCQQTSGDCSPVVMRPRVRVGHDPVDDAEEKSPEGPALEPCGAHRDAARTRRDLERANCACISASRPLVRSPRQLPMGAPACARRDGQPGGNAAPPFQRSVVQSRQDDRRFLGLWGALNRTPSPPPLSSKNSMPAASNARRSAASLADVTGISPSTTSARRIVATPTFEAAARSRALHRSNARAALI
jgi:hypothetical protein